MNWEWTPTPYLTPWALFEKKNIKNSSYMEKGAKVSSMQMEAEKMEETLVIKSFKYKRNPENIG